MENVKYEIKMLETLIEKHSLGEKINLDAKPVREVVKLERDERHIDTLILSMEYSGTVDGKPFKFKKNYSSFTEDSPQYALECLLIANNRLQMDYDRLEEAGIVLKEIFFSFQNSFMGLTGDASIKRPILRIQDFIELSRTGFPVSVDVHLSRPAITLKQEGIEKKGFGFVANFTFKSGNEQTNIEKLYDLGPYDDAKSDQEDIVGVANKRLERDCERLRSAGMEVDQLSFWPIWERVHTL